MPEQRGEAWVKGATPEQIVDAQQAGELVRYMGGQTVEEQAQERVVAATPDRVLAAAYGLTSLRGRGDISSNWLEKKRADMDDTQRAKLEWLEQATPREVYDAEKSGDLDYLTGQDVSKEVARLDAIRATVTAAVRG